MCNSPKYMQVKQSLLNKIQNKELLPGERLESESEFAQRYQVSMITIRKALSELANEGYLNRTKGKGTFVAYPSASSRRLVALTISCKDYQDSSVLQIIRGAQRILSDFQYAMIVEWNQSGPEEELAIIQKLITQGVEGFLIYPFDPVPSTSNYQIIDKKGIPYVLIDRYNPDYKTRFAGCDNYNGAILATRELLIRKHTKIKFASYHFFLSSEQERYDGYCNAMRQAGLAVSDANLLKDTDIDYDDLAADILARKTTAIVCCNDKLALKMMSQLSVRGIRIPQDVSVFGFDDWSGSQRFAVSLSTLKQDFEEEGANAAVLLINSIQGRFRRPDTRLLSGAQLILRESVCENPYA